MNSSMAATFSTYRTTTIVASSAAAGKPPAARKTTANWWAPLFGLSSEADYIAAAQSSTAKNDEISTRIGTRSEKSIFRGGFTEEKAKELRKRTIETSNFHDVMYHSAIAARLASDVSGGSER